jgi:hypothetical protein
MANTEENKKLYWFKLTDSFMTSENVDYIMSQPKGEKYIIIYQFLCLKCLNSDGILGRKLGEIFVNYEPEKLVRDFKYFTKKEIQTALNLFIKLGLLVEKNGVLVIENFERLIGSESKWANYKREERDKNKIGQCPNKVQKMSIQSKSVDIDTHNTHNNIKGECLLNFKEKHVKIAWCYTHCQKVNECLLPDLDDSIISRKNVEIEVDPELKELLDNAYIKK